MSLRIIRRPTLFSFPSRIPILNRTRSETSVRAPSTSPTGKETLIQLTSPRLDIRTQMFELLETIYHALALKTKWKGIPISLVRRHR